MKFFILAIIIITVLLFLIIRRYRLMNDKKAHIISDAVILSMELTGISGKKQAEAIIQLQVKPDTGKNFVTEIRKILNLEEYPFLQPGARLKVTYHPKKCRAVTIISESNS
jgi:hypothetical protein